jgi:hypothetical protein
MAMLPFLIICYISAATAITAAGQREQAFGVAFGLLSLLVMGLALSSIFARSEVASLLVATCFLALLAPAFGNLDMSGSSGNIAASIAVVLYAFVGSAGHLRWWHLLRKNRTKNAEGGTS